MRKICSLILIAISLSISGCSLNKTSEVNKNISGFDKDEEYVSMWVHVIEETPEGESYAKAVEKFNEKYDGKYFLDVEFVPRNESGGGYSDKVNASVISGGLPDVITVDGPNISAYAANNIIQPLKELSLEEKEEYLPSIIDQGTINGQLYALGAMESSVGFYYNKDIIEELGIEIPDFDNPWTWSELLEVCEKVSSHLEDGYAIDMPFPTGESTIYYYAPFIWANEGDFISEDGLNVDGIFNSEKNQEVLNYFEELVNKGYVAKVAIDNLFETGRAAFLFDGAWAINNISTNYPDLNLGIAPYPVGEDWNGEKYTPTGSWVYAVTKTSEKLEAATEVVKYMSGVESGVLLYKNTGNLPSTYGAYEQLEDFKEDGLFKELYTQLVKYGHPRPKSPAYPQISTSFQQAVEGVLLNDESSEEALSKSMRRIEDRLIRYQK